MLRGECLLIVEGQELQLRQGDYFHCRPTSRTDRRSGHGPSLVLAVGNRLGPDVIVYPRDETALKHGAGSSKRRRTQGGLRALTRPAPDVPFREEFLTG